MKWSRVSSIEHAINLLIYLSVALGLALLPQLFGIVSPWLFYSVVGGWLAYLIVALAVARGKRVAYYAALVLSVVTLAVSVPQPAHFALIGEGLNLAALTFIAGSVTQVLLLVLLTLYIIKTHRIEGS